jgi:hypothetical protein
VGTAALELAGNTAAVGFAQNTLPAGRPVMTWPSSRRARVGSAKSTSDVDMDYRALQVREPREIEGRESRQP